MHLQVKYEVIAGLNEVKDKTNPKVVWLHFTLKSLNTELLDLAPEGQRPFLMSPGREAWYRVEKP